MFLQLRYYCRTQQLLTLYRGRSQGFISSMVYTGNLPWEIIEIWLLKLSFKAIWHQQLHLSTYNCKKQQQAYLAKVFEVRFPECACMDTIGLHCLPNRKNSATHITQHIYRPYRMTLTASAMVAEHIKLVVRNQLPLFLRFICVSWSCTVRANSL